jgi:hypothetical protein
MTRLAVWWTLLPVTAPAPPPGAPGAPGADRGEEFGKTSPIALVVILLLGIATLLLIRSMTKRLRNVPASFDPPEQDADRGDADRSDAGRSDADGSGAVEGGSPSVGPDARGRPGTTGRAGLDRTEGPPGAGSP